MASIPRYPEPQNEPVLGYLPGSAERARLKQALASMSSQRVEVPLFIGGKEIGRIPNSQWSNPEVALDLQLNGPKNSK